MAIEEEFSIEIPDKDADEIRTVGDAIKYISEQAEYSSPEDWMMANCSAR